MIKFTLLLAAAFLVGIQGQGITPPPFASTNSTDLTTNLPVFPFTSPSPSGDGTITCNVGTIVYSEDMSMVYLALNVTQQNCESCYKYSWTNTDYSGVRSHIESGGCASPIHTYACSDLNGEKDIKEVENCNVQTCSESLCSNFTDITKNEGPQCLVGTITYAFITLTQLNVSNYANVTCPTGYECGMYRFNLSGSGNIVSIDSGLCVNPLYKSLYSCDNVINNTQEYNFHDCQFFSSSEDLKFDFLKPQKQELSECYVGKAIYDVTNRSVSSEDYKTEVCSTNMICQTETYLEMMDDGMKFVEIGKCANPSNFEFTGKVSQRFNQCQTRLCNKFLGNIPDQNCSPKAEEDDIQLLPRCTLKQVLNKTFECYGKIAAKAPFSSTDNCSSAADEAVSCLSNVIQGCFAMEDNNEPCDSAWNMIPGMSTYFQEISKIASRIKSVSSLMETMKDVFGMDVIDPSMLTAVCNVTLREPALEYLKNISLPQLNVGMPLCKDNRVLDDIMRWGLEAVKDNLMAKTHDELCLTFDKLKIRMRDLMMNRCNDFLAIAKVLVSKIGSANSTEPIENPIDMVLGFLNELNLPGCKGFTTTQTMCHQGYVAYINDTNKILDKNTTVDLCPNGYGCGMTRFFNILDGNAYYTESGNCIKINNTWTLPIENAPCPTNISDYPGIGEATNCSVDICNGSRCVNYKYQKDMKLCKATENDIALFPQCSANQTFVKVQGCVKNLMSSYPYDNEEMCRMDLDSTVKCLSESAKYCIEGDCTTILDNIPEIREIYMMVAAVAGKVDSFSDVLRMLNLSESNIDMIKGVVCHASGTSMPGGIMMPVDILKYVITQAVGSKVTICDPKLIPDVIDHAFMFLKTVFENREHTSFCKASNALKMGLKNIWMKYKCESKVTKMLQMVPLPAAYMEKIYEGLDMLQEFMEKLEMPFCNDDDSEGFTVPDCSRLHESSSPCAARKAWVCDYVSWKFDFMTTWLKQFYTYAEAHGHPIAVNLPGCALTEFKEICRNSDQQRCGSGPDGCDICFCMDHEYKDMKSITSMWKRDYARWARVMKIYKEIDINTMTEEGECGM